MSPQVRLKSSTAFFFKIAMIFFIDFNFFQSFEDFWRKVFEADWRTQNRLQV